jgi:hypothetical protein
MPCKNARRSGGRLSSSDLRAVSLEDSPKDAAMTPLLVLAVASYGEIRLMRQSRKSIDDAAVLGPRHLGFVPRSKSFPARWLVQPARRCDQSGARCKIREPHVEPVITGIPVLGNAARRPPDCSQPHAFPRASPRAKADDANRHRRQIYLRPQGTATLNIEPDVCRR